MEKIVLTVLVFVCANFALAQKFSKEEISKEQVSRLLNNIPYGISEQDAFSLISGQKEFIFADADSESAFVLDLDFFSLGYHYKKVKRIISLKKIETQKEIKLVWDVKYVDIVLPRVMTLGWTLFLTFSTLVFFFIFFPVTVKINSAGFFVDWMVLLFSLIEVLVFLFSPYSFIDILVIILTKNSLIMIFSLFYKVIVLTKKELSKP